MDLAEQIQILIDNAPQDGVTPKVVAAIAPGLQVLASKLSHLQYYILQSLGQEWVVTTLRDRFNPEITKNVIYAFPTLKDAADVSEAEPDPQIVALAIPITHILFQLFALETIDSIIFFETPGDLNTGTEIQRSALQNLIQLQLQQNTPKSTRPSQIPPDIA